jgi:hypothetical protein
VQALIFRTLDVLYPLVAKTAFRLVHCRTTAAGQSSVLAQGAAHTT